MAFTLTTLATGLGINDQAALFASLSGLVAGSLVGIDKEIAKVISVPTAATIPVPLARGQEGSFNQAHPPGAQVKIGAPGSQLTVSDWPVAAAGAPSLAVYPGAYAREVASYSLAGAIALPRIGADGRRANGTTLLAMTLAQPSIAQDGSRLLILGNGKAAHTVTLPAASGLGNVGGTADVITFSAAQAQGLEVVACGGFWVPVGMNTAVAGAGATINGVGLG
jgi:hypothetical protein